MVVDVTNKGDYQWGMERPNTVSGLQAKRAELVKLRELLQADFKKVTCDIDHLDACLRLFDPAAEELQQTKNRYATAHRAHFGHTKRFVLNALRIAEGPLTSVAITRDWIKDRGLEPDESTRVILTKRIGACITSLKGQGHIVQEGLSGEYKAWRLTS